MVKEIYLEGIIGVEGYHTWLDFFTRFELDLLLLGSVGQTGARDDCIVVEIALTANHNRNFSFVLGNSHMTLLKLHRRPVNDENVALNDLLRVTHGKSKLVRFGACLSAFQNISKFLLEFVCDIKTKTLFCLS